ncbi:putative L-type lectin-domain containing receptor kinase S.5 [Acorus calamus]|uniref:non-specific serine/threonine protein kinase n=1 Tax=Acorus calamus TaxID=4465 RepID=A0AAV9DSG7_ACOCL|nr:putative L-type lectin-domain containing receptor kinase S.5 [Acorus calamus]
MLHSLSSYDVLLLILTFLCLLTETTTLQFSYPTFESSNSGDFNYAAGSNLDGGTLQITPDATTFNITNRSGRVTYKETFSLWKKKGSVVASFNTTFVLDIYPFTRPGGEGLAFILANDRALPDYSSGPWLGIVNQLENGTSVAPIVAVEFDTRKSFPDDLDDNHIGVDINSVYSIHQVPLGLRGVNLSSDPPILASIGYDGVSKVLTVDVSTIHHNTTIDRSTPLISLPIDLSQLLAKDVHIGFSASTSEFTELNCILSWNFTSQDTVEEAKTQFPVVSYVVPSVVLFIIIPQVLCIGYWIKRLNKNKRSLDLELTLADSARGPHKFKFKDLKSATSNFSPKNKLGQGGFGTVYKGYLKQIDREVAVKRVSKDSRQGEQEFVAEVKTIGRLSHRNLVRLIGWCFDKMELLLVYEFFPKGSLDKLIFNAEPNILSWERRLHIIHGVASALEYIHDGCNDKVLHRDVKASNVMLDDEYNAKLGDFGLARVIRHGQDTHHSTKAIAGTPGYIAPECYITGRASVETDMYSFGVFIMELMCARRPTRCNEYESLVGWVWGMYGSGRVLDAVDVRLVGEGVDEERVERFCDWD